jgi:hypothetical protein
MNNNNGTIDFTNFSKEDLDEFNRLKKLHIFVSNQIYETNDCFGNVFNNYEILNIHIGKIRRKLLKILNKYNN